MSCTADLFIGQVLIQSVSMKRIHNRRLYRLYRGMKSPLCNVLRIKKSRPGSVFLFEDTAKISPSLLFTIRVNQSSSPCSYLLNSNVLDIFLLWHTVTSIFLAISGKFHCDVKMTCTPSTQLISGR